MKTFLIIVSSIFTIASVIPYAIEIIRGNTKPRIVSWFTWSLLTGIACAASFAAHQIPSAVLMLFATIETVSIVILGLKHGDRKLDKVDIICQIGALVGMGLWLLFDSPAIAVGACVAIDAIGAVPTFMHSWQKPHEETWSTFFLAGIGGLATVLAAGSWKITAIAYPIYIVIANVILVALILGSPNRKLEGEPSELRDL